MRLPFKPLFKKNYLRLQRNFPWVPDFSTISFLLKLIFLQGGGEGWREGHEDLGRMEAMVVLSTLPRTSTSMSDTRTRRGEYQAGWRPWWYWAPYHALPQACQIPEPGEVSTRQGGGHCGSQHRTTHFHKHVRYQNQEWWVPGRVDMKWRFQFFAKSDYRFLLDVIIAIIATFFAKAIITILRLSLNILLEW